MEKSLERIHTFSVLCLATFLHLSFFLLLPVVKQKQIYNFEEETKQKKKLCLNTWKVPVFILFT